MTIIKINQQPTRLIKINQQPTRFIGISAAGPQGPAGPGLAVGGTTGQVLSKVSDTDFDTGWSDPALGSGALLQADYRWSTDITATDPGSGRIKGDNASEELITEIYISETDGDGRGRQTLLHTLLSVGSYMAVASRADSSDNLIFQVSGSVTDNGTWATIPVTFISDGATLSNNEKIVTSFLISGSQTFAGLTDTPASIVADQYLVGNAGGTDLVFVAAIPVADVSGLATVATSGDYTDLTNIPATFAPSAHTHVEADITDLQGYLLDITAESIEDLSDVTFAVPPTAAQVMQYDGISSWVNTTMSYGDLSNRPSHDELPGVFITSVGNGEIMVRSGSLWVNNTLAEAGIAAASHTHVEADITDLGNYSVVGHTHLLADVTDSGTAAALDVPAAGDAAVGEVVKGSDTRLTDSRTPVTHTHAAADVVSGTFANSRISESSVLAHEAALTILETQLDSTGEDEGSLPVATGSGSVRWEDQAGTVFPTTNKYVGRWFLRTDIGGGEWFFWNGTYWLGELRHMGWGRTGTGTAVQFLRLAEGNVTPSISDNSWEAPYDILIVETHAFNSINISGVFSVRMGTVDQIQVPMSADTLGSVFGAKEIDAGEKIYGYISSLLIFETWDNPRIRMHYRRRFA